MRKASIKIISVLMGMAMILSGAACTADPKSPSDPAASVTDAAATDAPKTTNAAPTAAPTAVPTGENNVKDPEGTGVKATGNFNIKASVNDGFSESNGVYTITKPGEYILTGVLEDGHVVVNVGDNDEVSLVLSNVTIACSTASPICVTSAAEVKIKSDEGTYNEITDNREKKAETGSENDSENETDGNAAVYSKSDLSLTGKGTLVITGNYNNGVRVKGDLSVKNVNLKVTAANNGLKGDDSVTIESGDIIVIAKGGDGIKTTESNVSNKGKQRGTVSILGGNVDVHSCTDGIDAAYSAVIETDGNVNIYTDTYSEYSESRLNNGGTEFYIVVSSTYFTATYEYYAYFYNDDSQGVWRKAEYDTMISSGRTRYYGLLVSMPAGYANMRLVRMKKNTDPDLSLASALSEGGPVNTSMNAYVISSIDGAMINGDYSTVSVEGGSSGKAAYSAKGIKAGNDISINKGSVTIMSNDDAVHAKNDTTLENGKKGTGNVTISGGTVTITCTDDALHADGDLTINDGTVNIVKCYEGLEGNVITINGGSSFVFAYDDGMNASKGNSAALIKITGGYLEVTTPSGDTDAVDSNGNFIQTGGFVLIKGGSASGGVAGSVDVDGKINITGGNIAALGGVCETPTDSVNAYVSGNTTFEAGSYELKDDAGNLVMSFVLSDKYQGGWLASESLKTGTNYTLYKDGTAALTWTQESGTMGASGFGGWGGSHGGRR